MGDFLNHVGHEFTLGNVDSGPPITLQSKMPDMQIGGSAGATSPITIPGGSTGNVGSRGTTIPGGTLTVIHQPQRPSFLTAWLSQLPSAIPEAVAASRVPGGGFATGLAGGLQGIQNARTLQAQTGNLQSEARLRNAQADQMGTMVTLPNGMQMPYNLAAKIFPSLLNNESREKIAGQSDQTKRSIANLKAGYDENGQPLAPEKLSIPSQIQNNLRLAQTQLQKARLDALNADPNTAAGSLALRRLGIQEQNARAQATRAAAAMNMSDVAQKKFAEDYVSGITNPYTGEQQGIQQFKAQQPTSSSRTMGELAGSLRPHIADIQDQVMKLDEQGKLGPLAGKFNDFMTGKVGANDPDFNALRTSIGLLQTGVGKMHLGARGSQMFQQKIEGLFRPGMSAADIIAGLDEVDKFAEGYEKFASPAFRSDLPPASNRRTQAQKVTSANEYFKKFN